MIAVQTRFCQTDLKQIDDLWLGVQHICLYLSSKDAEQNKTCVVSADENSVLQTHDQSAVPEKEATNKQSI